MAKPQPPARRRPAAAPLGSAERVAPAPAGGSLLGRELIGAGLLDEQQLALALRLQSDTNVRVGQALLSLGLVSAVQLTQALARQHGLQFVDLTTTPPEPAVARLLPPALERDRGVLPLWEEQGTIVVACRDLPGRCRLDDLAQRLGRPLRPVLVTEQAFDEALSRVYREEYLHQATSLLRERSPDDTAGQVLSRGQQVVLLLLLAATIVGLVLTTLSTLAVLAGLAVSLYTALAIYKLRLVQRGLTQDQTAIITPSDIAALDERDLPIYTILVPVYREAEVFPILVRAIAKLDYPKAKLDVRILLEENDAETIEVARQSNLPSYFRLVIVPDGPPKSKPKACNYGLIQALGEMLVIYDAEDIPEPDQLKKAIIAFRRGQAQLGCVQAKLNYFNATQNVLTRWFTAEYSTWFDLLLPGLDASNAPIPLGGTSNHFKIAVLRELAGWDPNNVTEDADLGLRLHKAGWKTSVIDSTTYEEANSEVYNWIRQRSRWIKGYIQTYLVHMRHPLRLLRAVGLRSFLSFQLLIGGTFFVLLLNPIFWLLTLLWILTESEVIQAMFPSLFFYLGALALFFGNFSFVYINVIGCLQREHHGMVKYALLSPLYWALMSIAAWKGFLQLFYAPNYWEKTRHGLFAAAGGQVELVDSGEPTHQRSLPHGGPS